MYYAALPTGTVIWSNPGDGSGVISIVPAVPSATGVADVFALNNDCNVQAIRSDGSVAWTANIGQPPQYSENFTACNQFVPDFQGGFVVKSETTTPPGWLEPFEYHVQKFDGMTGQAYPAYDLAGWCWSPLNFTGTLNGCALGSSGGDWVRSFSPMVVHPDGTVFTIDGIVSLLNGNFITFGEMFVDVIDPLTGQQKARIGLTDSGGGTGNLIVAGDGYAYVPFFSVSNWDICPGVQKNYMKLARIDTSGNASFITLGEWDTSCPPSIANVPAVSIITNADQGVLVSWETQISVWTGEVFEPQSTTYYVATVNGGSLVSQGTTGQLLQPVLQAQDGSFYGTDNNGNMVKFDQSGSVQWSVPGDSPQIATADGGVVGASSIIYDSNGRATGQVGSTSSAAMTSTRAAVSTYGAAQATAEDASGSLGSFLTAAQSWTSDWYQIATASVNQLLIPPILPATPPYSSFNGANPSANATSPPCHDDRDQFTPEYVTYNSGFVPFCVEFVSSIPVAGFPYPFETMNQDDITYNDHPKWALLRQVMLNGIINILNNYDGSAPAVTSGYRSPYVQTIIDPSKTVPHTSAHPHEPHMKGLAVDMRTGGLQAVWQELHDIGKSTAVNACVEPYLAQAVFNMPQCYNNPNASGCVIVNNPYNHIHFDWGRTCPQDTRFGDW